MTAARLRWWLAILALTLGAGAAIVRTPPPAHARATAIYKPPNGC